MRIIEGGYDDRPLRGPWSRRESAPPNDPSNYPQTTDQNRDIVRGPIEERDGPLSGPWDGQKVPNYPESVKKEEAPDVSERKEHQPLPLAREQFSMTDQTSDPDKPDEASDGNRRGDFLNKPMERPICPSIGTMKNLFSRPAFITDWLWLKYSVPEEAGGGGDKC